MQEILIGRHKEKQELIKWCDSGRSEFIAVYGRRRVGKTFLIRKAIGDNFTFHFSASVGMSRKEHLLNFGLALREQSGDSSIMIPENWIMAFHSLKHVIDKSEKKKKIIFLDELPWLDTPKSGFVKALENFWNSWASWRNDIKLIVCGSATSWIINKIIRDKGGLHNRITHTLLVPPFQLKECEEYFDAYGFRYSRMQIAECYMTLGGIPYYFSLMEPAKSVVQNIDALFFAENAPLKNEFEDLYRALYKNYQDYVKVIKALAEKGMGLTRQELLQKTKLANNGEFSKILEELELCGFIRSYLPYSERYDKNIERVSRDTLFQLIDFFSLFYLKFHGRQKSKNENFWSSMVNSPLINTWRGLTFELLCLCHINRIKVALGIADVSTSVYSWRGGNNGEKTQIDLLIDRNDFTINLCEIKFSYRDFTIDRAYAEKLGEKIEIFMEATKTKKNILLTLITTIGLKNNPYSHLIQRLVTLDDLF